MPMGPDVIQRMRAWLAGRKTYGIAAIGILYIVGCWAGWWAYDERILAALGLGGLATLRAGLSRTTRSTAPLLLLSAGCIMLTGCAMISSTQIDESPERKITTTVKGRAFFASSATLQKLAATTTDKTQSFGLASAATVQTNSATVLSDLVRLVELLRE